MQWMKRVVHCGPLSFFKDFDCFLSSMKFLQFLSTNLRGVATLMAIVLDFSHGSN